MTQLRIVCRFVAFEPKNLGRGKPRENQVARLANGGFRPAELFRDDRTFRRRARVAPQLRRTDHLAVGVERHEAVLLSRNADPPDPRAVDFCGYFAQHKIQRGRPLLRMLLHMAHRQTRDQGVWSARLGHDLAGAEIEDDRFNALSSGIDADVEGHAGHKE